MMCLVEVDDDVDVMTPPGGSGEVSVETQLSTYLQLQMQMFRSVVGNNTAGGQHEEDDDSHVHDLVDRFGTLQDRQMKIITAIQQSRYDAQQVTQRHQSVRAFCIMTMQNYGCGMPPLLSLVAR